MENKFDFAIQEINKFAEKAKELQSEAIDKAWDTAYKKGFVTGFAVAVFLFCWIKVIIILNQG